MLRTMSEFEKIGILCIGDSHDKARYVFDKRVATLESLKAAKILTDNATSINLD